MVQPEGNIDVGRLGAFIRRHSLLHVGKANICCAPTNKQRVRRDLQRKVQPECRLSYSAKPQL